MNAATAFPIAANGDMYDPAQAEEFIAMLYRHVDWQPGQIISLLGIGEKGTAQEGVFRDRQLIAPGFIGAVHGHLKRWAANHVAGFIVPAVLHAEAHEGKGGGALDKVALLTAIVLDIDSGDVSAKAKYVIDRLGKPSMTVASGGLTDEGKLKAHLWWLLSEPSDEVERVAALRKLLAAKVGGDQSFGRATQVVRVPGSVHAKHGKASLCRILERCDADYSLDDLADIIEGMAAMPGLPTPVTATQLLMLTLAGGMDFTPRQDTAVAALHRDINEGGDELTRWGEFSKVAGFNISEIRAGRLTPEGAYTALNGWVFSHMVPPWPQARIDQEFRALLTRDIANHGPMHLATLGPLAPAQREVAFLPLDLWPVQNVPIAPPEFPAYVLGKLWANWVQGSAASAGAPVSYVGISLLVGAAALIGNARRVSHGSWIEPPILWAMMVGDPSTGKTPALRPVQAILTTFDRDISAGFPAEKTAFMAKEATARLAKEAWEKAVKAALGHGQTPPPMPKNATAPDMPICPNVVVKDVTPEKLGYLSNASPKGLIMVRDEAAGWLGGMNRFSGGGERQVWLESYNGDVGKIDRVKLDSSIHIDHFSVCVLGGIQPDRLNLILRDDPDDGLIPRFLFAFPDPVPPVRAAKWTPNFDPVALMRKLYSLKLVNVDDVMRPIELPLTDSAADLFEKWRQAHYVDSSTVEGMAVGSWGKMPGQLLRLALVLEFIRWTECAESPEPSEVQKDSITGAIELIDKFFKPMARRTLGAAGGSQKIYAAKVLAEHMIANRLTILETRQVMNSKGCPGILRKPEQMDPACAELVDAGWLLPIQNRAGGTKGKLPKSFEVRPDLWAALEQERSRSCP